MVHHLLRDTTLLPFTHSFNKYWSACYIQDNRLGLLNIMMNKRANPAPHWMIYMLQSAGAEDNNGFFDKVCIERPLLGDDIHTWNLKHEKEAGKWRSENVAAQYSAFTRTKGENEISMFKNKNKTSMAAALGGRVAITQGWKGEQESDCEVLLSHGKEFEFYSKCQGSHWLVLRRGCSNLCL